MNKLEETVKQQGEMLEEGKEYSASEIMANQLAYLYKTSREEGTTTEEKIELSLAMVRIFEAI
ncbi:hypothetical protein [Enterococcus wangshanyuanii]|uniref:Uncharacterized protein n=1 Tax=Enterococcus wangshanyuanii TaxID=2005703 RepID=A0ABQ1P3H8_9ENTE|nr:hypothetical protein [Enterococcus wangshanyuanii]GGC88311.1 hypothetical protein GCM10011573_17400 [Enterococcus wangshanyuanii]